LFRILQQYLSKNSCDIPSPLRERVRVRVAQKLPLILTFSPEGRRNG